MIIYGFARVQILSIFLFFQLGITFDRKLSGDNTPTANSCKL